MSAHSPREAGRSAPGTLPLGFALATALGAWLRLYGLGEQVVQDDEWHAIHKLMAAGYAEIFRSFGMADHSIPLTLFYKAMAETAGLTEINLRIVQVLAGIALIPLAGAIAWRITASVATSLLYAFLVAGAPFLILYSRVARPYAITTLLAVLALAGLWRWRESRSLTLAVAVCGLTALSAWLHPISAAFPAVAMLFIFAEDLRARKGVRAIVQLGLAAAVAIAVPLAAPVMHDLPTLAAKAGGDFAGGYTVARMLALFAGGFPDAVTYGIVAFAAFGAVRVFRMNGALGAYLAALAVVPVALFMGLGAAWTHQGHTFARYVFPVQLIFLLWAAVGIVDAARLLSRRSSQRVETAVAVAAAAAYIAFNPAVRQVATLGPWYGHVYHQFDYAAQHNAAALQYRGYDAPRFYRELGALPPGAAPVIEAPFTYEAPANSLAFFRGSHGQPERIGMLHDLCLDGPYYGEVPHDARFRFRNFVFLGDRDSVRASGARYLLLHLDQLHGKPFAGAQRCMAALAKLYGAPVDVDPRLAVFDLRPEASPRKLQ
jgi:hypothetical protein